MFGSSVMWGGGLDKSMIVNILLSDYNKNCHISYIFLFKCYHIHMHTQTCSSLLPEPVVPHKHTHTHTHTHISAQKMDFPLLEGLPQGFFFLVEVWAHLF